MQDRSKGIIFAQLNAFCAGMHFAAGVLPLSQISRQTGNDIAAGIVIAAMYYLVAAPVNTMWWGLTRLKLIPVIGKQPELPGSAPGQKGVLLSAVHILCSALGIALFWMGMQHATTAIAAVLSRLEILFVIVMGFTLLRERFSHWQWIGFALTLCGILLIRQAPLHGDMRGITILLCSALSFAVALVAGKLAMQHVSVQALMLVRAWSMAALLCLAWLMVWPQLPQLDARGLMWLVISAVSGPFLARNNYMLAVSYLPASQVVLLNQAQPIYAALLGFLLNAEIPGSMVVLGGAAIILGNIVLIVARDRGSNS
ncbi:MAG: EamA family transporter [Planctomycetales bacterium]|nr:EamA family transporter [bacterium]UNM07726.1 MAG: EamA family transporter [Planctomycetales bacterium]